MLMTSLIDGNKTNYGDVRIKVSGSTTISNHPDFDRYSVNGGAVINSSTMNLNDGDIVDLYLSSNHSGSVTLYHFKDVLVEVVDWKLNDNVNRITLRGCNKLTKVPDYLPKSITSTSSMFSGCTSFNQNINSWDVSNVTNMWNMFSSCSSFNQPMGNWNVSKVTEMGYMFDSCTNFNQNINSWDVSNVTNMGGMFQNCTSFNQDINSWDVSNVINMGSMFESCTKFNQNINNWNVSNVTDMDRMFVGCFNFNQNLSNLIFKSTVNSDNYDLGTTAWLTSYRPKFTG